MDGLKTIWMTQRGLPTFFRHYRGPNDTEGRKSTQINEQFFIDLIFPGRRDFSTLQIQENSAAHHQAWLFPALLELDAVSKALITIAIVSSAHWSTLNLKILKKSPIVCATTTNNPKSDNTPPNLFKKSFLSVFLRLSQEDGLALLLNTQYSQDGLFMVHFFSNSFNRFGLPGIIKFQHPSTYSTVVPHYRRDFGQGRRGMKVFKRE